MKKIIYLALTLITQYIYADPLIVVVLMVKNEEPVIVQTLEPLVEGGIDAYLIFDTGSTDATIEKARDFFTMRGIKNFHIEQEPFVDFSISRNRALDLAEQHFPDAIFMLMPDAEWQLQNTKDLVDFCSQHKNDQEPSAYLVRMLQGGSMDYYNCRLLRCRRTIRFTCPVHEYVDYPASVKVPEHIFFAWNRTEYGSEKSAKRWIRDRDILLKSYHENPSDPRTLFYLAQTYECLNDQEKAYHFYQERVRMAAHSWNEETYMSYYRLGQITEILASTYSDRYDWALAQFYYLKAYAVRPSRAEPLIKIAEYYLAHDNHVLAYLFASRAVAIPYPKDDFLFVEKPMYTYARYDILGRSAWYIGEFDKGEQALRKGLKENPDNAHFRSNLSFYLQRNIALGKYGVRAVEIPAQEDSLKGSKVWSILICTITERKEQLDFIVEKLKKQIQKHGLQNRIEILIFSDNRGDCSIGFKRNALMQASVGTYINFIDDDDDIHEEYIKMIYDKLQTGPDCVSLVGIRTQDGMNPHLFVHSLEYNSYFMENGIFYRPPNHLNPIKRELIINSPFLDINWGEDTNWAMAVANSGCLKTQEIINEPYYFYNYVSKS